MMLQRWSVIGNTLARRIVQSLKPVLALGSDDLEPVRSEFDVDFYRRKYPDIGHTDPFTHYVQEGWLKGYDPNRWFSTKNYLDQHEDVRAAGVNPFVHYILYGRAERRSIGPMTIRGRLEAARLANVSAEEIYKVIESEFDTEYYATTNPQLRDTETDLIQHYVKVGWKLGKNPNPRFNTRFYLESNADVKAAKVHPFYHFLRVGRPEGRSPHPAANNARRFLFKGLLSEKPPAVPQLPPNSVAVVVPIYNNYDDVSELLPNLAETVGDADVILVNDASPDGRILPLLKKWCEPRERWRLIENAENMGFARSVNRGIEAAGTHVVVLNSDLALPPQWLERLIQPILEQPDAIATVTPFSNHSSLTGFPRPRCEIPLKSNDQLETIDRAFRIIKPVYPDIPAGVGFCLAMNRNVISKVGGLDAESYRRGYYEDTDWAQRAILAGYRNVVCGNLFVHHEVGSKSFSVEGRKRLSDENRDIFLRKFPHYPKAETAFYQNDPLRELRSLARVGMWRANAASARLIVNHSWGGGANHFSDRLTSDLLQQNGLVIELILQGESMKLVFRYREELFEIQQAYTPDIWKLTGHLNIDEVIVNGVHAASRIRDVIHALKDVASERAVTIYVHDFLAACPSIFLLTDEHRYCGIPDLVTCQKCYFANRNIKYDYVNIVEWRRDWRALLERAHEIRVFTQASIDILARAFPGLQSDRMKVVDPAYPVSLQPVPRRKPSEKLRIGVLGAMLPHKGSRLLVRLGRHIRQGRLNAQIILIGAWNDSEPPDSIQVLGPYEVYDLHGIVSANNIDVMLFPSVCPETFSNTLSEIFALELPVVGLPIGAQGERIARYKYGKVVSSDDPDEIFNTLVAAAQLRNPAEKVPA